MHRVVLAQPQRLTPLVNARNISSAELADAKAFREKRGKMGIVSHTASGSEEGSLDYPKMQPGQQAGPGGVLIGAPDMDDSKKPKHDLGSVHQGAIVSTTPPDFPCYYWDPVECRHKTNFMWGIGGRKLPKLPIGTKVNGMVMGEYGLYKESRRKHQDVMENSESLDPFGKYPSDFYIKWGTYIAAFLCTMGGLHNTWVLGDLPRTRVPRESKDLAS